MVQYAQQRVDQLDALGRVALRREGPERRLADVPGEDFGLLGQVDGVEYRIKVRVGRELPSELGRQQALVEASVQFGHISPIATAKTLE